MISLFEHPTSTRRQIPDSLYVFQQRVTLLSRLLPEDHPLNEAIKKYGHGWKFDGVHEDLGPVNGPLPLQELVKANYIYLASMIRSFSEREKPTNSNTV